MVSVKGIMVSGLPKGDVEVSCVARLIAIIARQFTTDKGSMKARVGKDVGMESMMLVVAVNIQEQHKLVAVHFVVVCHWATAAVHSGCSSGVQPLSSVN